LLCQGKTIYVGSLWKAVNYTDVEGNSKTVTTRIVYKVIERTMDKNGQLLIMPDIECNTIRKYKLNMALYMAVKRLYL